jgi:hypothetical protein
MVFSGPGDPTNRMFFFSVMAARAISLWENYRSRMVSRKRVRCRSRFSGVVLTSNDFGGLVLFDPKNSTRLKRIAKTGGRTTGLTSPSKRLPSSRVQFRESTARG